MEMRAEFSIFCFLQLLILLIVWLKRATNSILLIFPTRLVLMKQLLVRYLHSGRKKHSQRMEKCATIKSEARCFLLLVSGGKKPSKGPSRIEINVHVHFTVIIRLVCCYFHHQRSSSLFWGFIDDYVTCFVNIWQNPNLASFLSVWKVSLTSRKVQRHWWHNVSWNQPRINCRSTGLTLKFRRHPITYPISLPKCELRSTSPFEPPSTSFYRRLTPITPPLRINFCLHKLNGINTQ